LVYVTPCVSSADGYIAIAVKELGMFPPRPARPEPKSVVIGQLTDHLRAECPAAFAGVAWARDGLLEIYSTGDDRLAALVAEFAPRAAPHFRMRVVAGATNGLEDLEVLHERVRMERADIERDGVAVLSSGVDILANRLRIGVREMDPDKVSYLEARYGRGRIRVEEAGFFRP
jgi:hypothetical protein